MSNANEITVQELCKPWLLEGCWSNEAKLSLLSSCLHWGLNIYIYNYIYMYIHMFFLHDDLLVTFFELEIEARTLFFI